MSHDPLLQYEIELAKKSHSHSRMHRFVRWTKFIGMYFIVTGVIFAVLMAIMNFSAYSARLTQWINPALFASMQANIQSALDGSNISVHAATTDSRESLETITEKISLTDPDVIYSRSYGPENLLNGVSRTSGEATFEVAPYENRVIIPRLGKNIPLVDVDHDANAPYSEMHEIFMKELEKGIVRYPGTAKPGEVGNTFIFGHSSNYPWVKSDYNDVFALIDTLQNGDEIIVYYNQHKYVYKITDRATVRPGDTKVLASRDPNKKEISLMTCWPIGTTLERYIIFGELVTSD